MHLWLAARFHFVLHVLLSLCARRRAQSAIIIATCQACKRESTHGTLAANLPDLGCGSTTAITHPDKNRVLAFSLSAYVVPDPNRNLYSTHRCTFARIRQVRDRSRKISSGRFLSRKNVHSSRDVILVGQHSNGTPLFLFYSLLFRVDFKINFFFCTTKTKSLGKESELVFALSEIKFSDRFIPGTAEK